MHERNGDCLAVVISRESHCRLIFLPIWAIFQDCFLDLYFSGSIWPLDFNPKSAANWIVSAGEGGFFCLFHFGFNLFRA